MNNDSSSQRIITAPVDSIESSGASLVHIIIISKVCL